MQINPDGSVRVEKGEMPPIVCEQCGFLYPPTAGSVASRCRTCGYGNLHWLQTMTWETEHAAHHVPETGTGDVAGTPGTDRSDEPRD